MKWIAWWQVSYRAFITWRSWWSGGTRRSGYTDIWWWHIEIHITDTVSLNLKHVVYIFYQHKLSSAPLSLTFTHTYLHMQVLGDQRGQGALEVQDVHAQEVQVGPEDLQALEDPRWIHLLDPAGSYIHRNSAENASLHFNSDAQLKLKMFAHRYPTE